MKSGLDLRPKPPPSRVTLTFTLSADIPSRLAMRSRAACGDVSIVADHLPRLARRLLERRLEGRGIVRGVRAIVPLDLEGLPALDRGPGVATDHRDAAQRVELRGRRARLDFHHADHSRH